MSFIGNLVKGAIPSVLALYIADAGTANAAVATASFQVKINIQASCAVVSAPDLDFGTAGALVSAVTATTVLSVQCTNTTPYNIGLDAGTGVGATVASRKLTGPSSATINYSLYQSNAYSTVWGTTIGTDTVAATGTGAAQSFTIYGRVPAQTTPAPGLYVDTVTVTVTY